MPRYLLTRTDPAPASPAAGIAPVAQGETVEISARLAPSFHGARGWSLQVEEPEPPKRRKPKQTPEPSEPPEAPTSEEG